MRAQHRSILSWMLAVCALAPAAVRAADPGSSGALFLRLGMGARAAGMGEAFAAVAEDASSIYWNPAAMAPVLGTNVTLMHDEYLQSLRLEQAAITHETRWGTFGLSFTGMYMDDLERRDDIASAIPLGTFAVYDVSFALAYARYVAPNLAVGVSVKSIYESIDELHAAGVAIDAGVYHVAQIEGLKLAAVVANVGTPMKFDQQEFALPLYLKIAGSYSKDIPAIRGGMLLALDLMFPNDDDVREHVGVEFDYQNRFFLRTGYKAGYDSQGATFGLGAVYEAINVDYALLLVRNDLGDSHRFGVGFRF